MKKTYQPLKLQGEKDKWAKGSTQFYTELLRRNRWANLSHMHWEYTELQCDIPYYSKPGESHQGLHCGSDPLSSAPKSFHKQVHNRSSDRKPKFKFSWEHSLTKSIGLVQGHCKFIMGCGFAVRLFLRDWLSGKKKRTEGNKAWYLSSVNICFWILLS